MVETAPNTASFECPMIHRLRDPLTNLISNNVDNELPALGVHTRHHGRNTDSDTMLAIRHSESHPKRRDFRHDTPAVKRKAQSAALAQAVPHLGRGNTGVTFIALLVLYHHLVTFLQRQSGQQRHCARTYAKRSARACH